MYAGTKCIQQSNPVVRLEVGHLLGKCDDHNPISIGIPTEHRWDKGVLEGVETRRVGGDIGPVNHESEPLAGSIELGVRRPGDPGSRFRDHTGERDDRLEGLFGSFQGIDLVIVSGHDDDERRGNDSQAG